MSTSRHSVAPSSVRRKTSLLPLSASHAHNSSFSAATSSNHANFSFRPHLLLNDDEPGWGDGTGTRPLLDFSELTERIDIFKELFVAHLNHTTTEIERAKHEHVKVVGDEQRNVDLVKERIERQKEDQRVLYQNIGSERQAESSAQSQLSLLQSSRASLAQRLQEAENERDKLQATLDRKTKERDSRKQKLTQQIRRNKPELQRFNEKLGCRVSAGGGDSPNRDQTIIKFTFNLIDPSDWTYEANFIIDASRAQYKILSATPALPSDKLERLLGDLNATRALFTFIKSMRSAFKEQIEFNRRQQKNIFAS